MPDYKFNTEPGVTVARELLIAYLNTGTYAAPVWSPIGKRVEDSSLEMDWQTETKVDIFGDSYTTGKKPTMTQTFEPCELDSLDEAQQKLWNLAIKDKDVNRLLNQDMLIAHFYASPAAAEEGQAAASPASFAERYEACSVLPTGLGGEGGGSVGMPIEVTYGGTRTLGTVAKAADGSVTFTPDGTTTPQSFSMRSKSMPLD